MRSFSTFRSVQFKVAALIFGAVLIASLVNQWHGVQATTDALVEGAKSKLTNSLASRKERIEAKLRLASADLKFLLQAPAIQGLLRALDNYNFDPLDNTTTKQWVVRMTRIFSGLLRARPDYFQARYLLADGSEVIRVDRKNGKVVVPPEQQRQNQVKAVYFTSTISLPKGGLYVSPVQLNREGGKIEVPYRPTIRYAVPVYDSGSKPRGMLIIDVEASSFLATLQASLGADDRTLLLNQQGFYLAHPDPNKE